MIQITTIGCQELHKRLLDKDTPITLDVLMDVSHATDDTFHTDITQCEEVYQPHPSTWSDAPHRNIYRWFINMYTDTLSISNWIIAHGETATGKEIGWHSVYLYHSVERTEDIQELRIYKLKNLEQDEPTHVTFSSDIISTPSAYRKVEFHPDPVHALPYEYQDSAFMWFYDALEAGDWDKALCDRYKVGDIHVTYKDRLYLIWQCTSIHSGVDMPIFDSRSSDEVAKHLQRFKKIADPVIDEPTDAPYCGFYRYQGVSEP